MPDVLLKRIGVGYDGSPEADAALALAGSLAAGGVAKLSVTAVVDDRVPVLLRSALEGMVMTEWQNVIAEEEQRLRDRGLLVAKATGTAVSMDVRRGRPADALLALSDEVDLLVIGSRRWGPATRVLLGSTGEALMRDAVCPVLAVPRPGRVR
jgi:nucleotide-binding universal stress UspA family protein